MSFALLRAGQTSPGAPRRAARGQSLVITVMIMLVVVLMVFFTFSVGERTRKKMRMQALADSAAYSSAVAEARAMNFYALTNRAIISNMVSILSVSAHNSWMSWYEDMLFGAVENWRNIAGSFYDKANVAGSGCAPCRARLDLAARTAFDIADWYALAMPTRGGMTMHSGGMALPGIPAPWGARPRLFPNLLWDWNGGNPQRVPYRPHSAVGSWFDDICYNLRTPANQRTSGVSLDGENARCEARMSTVRGVRGAYWMHRQFHAKVDGEWCSLMQMGRRQHFDNAIITRAMQLSVERELVLLLRGSMPARPHLLDKPLDINAVRTWLFRIDPAHIDTDPSPGDGTEGAAGGAIDFYDPRNQSATAPPPPMPLAQTLARKVDPQVSVTRESAILSARLYMDAIVPQYAPGATPRSDPDDPAASMSHRDFDQMSFTARYPQWIFQRRVQGFSDHLLREENWRLLHLGAQRIAARGGGGSLTNYAWYYGNAKSMPVRELPGLAQEPSLRNPSVMGYRPTRNEYINENTWWLEGIATPSPGYSDPHYREGRVGQDVDNWYSHRPVHGRVLVRALEDEAIARVFGRNFGHASHDWGNVFSDMRVGSACAAACNYAQSTIDQWKGRDANWQRGDGEAPKGIHFFHGEAPHIGHRQGSVNQSTDHQYVGHMRFAATTQPDDVWGSPRTVVMLTRPVLDSNVSIMGQLGRRPWDFSFRSKIFGDLSFQTINGAGDSLAGDEMAAAASGLVYYHQPTRWEEPPNLWNPFWRAKLHPLRRDQLLQAGHAATTAAVRALPPTAINE